MESDSRSLRQGDGTLEELMRERILATIETLIDEELEAALSASRSQRVGFDSRQLPAWQARAHADDVSPLTVEIAWPSRLGQLRQSINSQLIR